MTSSPKAQARRLSNPTAPSALADPSNKLSTVRRISSSAKDRLSVYSNTSHASQHRSRPGSHVFPPFHSSLPYAIVRDFAYPPSHPLHYGPLPAPSRVSTPASEGRRLSDSHTTAWDVSRSSWAASWTSDPQGTQQLPAMSFGDGWHYGEDDELHSSAAAARHRKLKSADAIGRARSPSPSDFGGPESDRGTLVSLNGDGSETYYVRDDNAFDDGPGGEYVTYGADEARYSHYQSGELGEPGVSYYDEGYEYGDQDIDPDASYPSGSPDEEMHGKAVALFDFEREHENELPLREGQIIMVSYRHGQGWLVAEDPETGESGLVPESFVRLVRDIEGGLNSLNGEPDNDDDESDTDTEQATIATHEAGDPVPSLSESSADARDSHDKESHKDTTPEDSQQSQFESKSQSQSQNGVQAT